MRLIDANRLVEWLIRAGRYLKGIENSKPITKTIGKIIDHVKEMPTVDAVEVVHGQWVCPDFDFSDYWKCSACNEEFYFEDDPTEIPCNYCPNCGAKMDGGKDDGN